MNQVGGMEGERAPGDILTKSRLNSSFPIFTHRLSESQISSSISWLVCSNLVVSQPHNTPYTILPSHHSSFQPSSSPLCLPPHSSKYFFSPPFHTSIISSYHHHSFLPSFPPSCPSYISSTSSLHYTSTTAPQADGTEHRRPPSPVSAVHPSRIPHRHAPHHLTPPQKHHSSLTRVSSPTHASSHTPYSQIHPRPHPHPHPHHPHPLMNDANFSRTSPTVRTTSLADLVHKTETTPPLQLIPRPHTANSDDGSQQERNTNQRPPISNLPRLPPPGDASRTTRNTQNIETFPKHNYRKRKLSNSPANPPDFSSLTQKPDDHASSVIHHPTRVRVSPQRPDESHPEKRLRPEGIEGSTEMLPSINPEQQSPSTKLRRRSIGKDSRFDLLEENRALRIELENAKYRIRKLESIRRRQNKDIEKRDILLNRYRSQLVGLFETGDDDMFRINKPRPIRTSSRSPENHEDKDPSRIDGESISNSHEEEDWSVYSAPSDSYDRDRSDERKRNQDRTLYGRSEDGIRKHRRTRAPAWTPQEEERFLEAYAKHGCRWKMFQEALPGRSRRQIQSHGSYLIRQGKLPKKNSRPWQRRKPVSGVPSSSVKEAEIDLDDAERSDREGE